MTQRHRETASLSRVTQVHLVIRLSCVFGVASWKPKGKGRPEIRFIIACISFVSGEAEGSEGGVENCPHREKIPRTFTCMLLVQA